LDHCYLENPHILADLGLQLVQFLLDIQFLLVVLYLGLHQDLGVLVDLDHPVDLNPMNLLVLGLLVVRLVLGLLDRLHQMNPVVQ
jgi:hypothetical protein